MILLRKLIPLALAAVCILARVHSAASVDGLSIYKSLPRDGTHLQNPVVEEDYPQVPTYLWTEYDVLKGEDKRSGKFKNYMLNKDSEGNVADNSNRPGPVIRSYIPRTSSKRVPGAILNWAFTPQQKAGRFHSGYYRSQAHLRPAALE